jgi:hypothetical protein
MALSLTYLDEHDLIPLFRVCQQYASAVSDMIVNSAIRLPLGFRAELDIVHL